MRNPPIIRAVVSDHFGYVLCDSAEPRYWRPGPARPPIVRRYAPPAAPVADALHVVGYVAGRGRITVTLSDGSQLTERDSSLVRIDPRFVELSDGRRLPIRPRVESVSRVVPPVAAVVPSPVAVSTSPVLRDEGAWVRGADGVARLRERETIAPNR